MYANPALSMPLKKKIQQLSCAMAKVPRASKKWHVLNILCNELMIEWATLRMKTDPLATTYK